MYKKAIDLNFTVDGNAYNYIDQAFKALGDNETGLKYLEEGFAKYPKNQMVLLSLINYYLNKNEEGHIKDLWAFLRVFQDILDLIFENS